MESEQNLISSSSPQIQGADMELMNPFLLLHNLMLMPLYLFTQMISSMFGTMQFTPAMPVTPYQLPLSSPLPSAAADKISQAQTPRTTYTNTEEWELKRDREGRLQAIVIHRKATTQGGGEMIDVTATK